MTSQSSARTRGLVVGLGTMGSNHLRVLSQIDGVEVAAAVDPSPERRATAERSLRGLRTFATMRDALDVVEPDFACLAAPVAELAELAHEALLAGVPVLVALKQRLDAGHAGRIFQMHARRLSPFPDRDSLLGVALDLSTHDIDVMRFVSGHEVERVYAETARRLHDRAEDLVCATLRFDDGATGLLETNWLTPAKVRQLSVTGEAGTFVVDYLTQELSFFEHPTSSTDWSVLQNMRGAGEGDMTRYALQRREPLRVQWEAFLDALDGTSPPRATGRDGFAALSTARAIQRSGAEHAPTVPGYRQRDTQPVGA